MPVLSSAASQLTQLRKSPIDGNMFINWNAFQTNLQRARTHRIEYVNNICFLIGSVNSVVVWRSHLTGVNQFVSKCILIRKLNRRLFIGIVELILDRTTVYRRLPENRLENGKKIVFGIFYDLYFGGFDSSRPVVWWWASQVLKNTPDKVHVKWRRFLEPSVGRMRCITYNAWPAHASQLHRAWENFSNSKLGRPRWISSMGSTKCTESFCFDKFDFIVFHLFVTHKRIIYGLTPHATHSHSNA